MDKEMEQFYIRIGNNLRILRQCAGKTQNDLCELLNKSQTTMSHYESGTAKMSLDSVYRICRYFSISISDFLEDEIKIDKESVSVKQDNSLSPIEKACLSDRVLYLYYIGTGAGKVVESNLVLNEICSDSNLIDFIFEDKSNFCDQQLYEGNMVVERQHYFFYLNNQARNERGLFVTYRYPYKDKKAPFGLMGVMVSLSHGEARPCVQRCVLSSEKLLLEEEKLKAFLRLEFDLEKNINTDYVKYLRHDSDKKLYRWIKELYNKRQ